MSDNTDEIGQSSLIEGCGTLLIYSLSPFVELALNTALIDVYLTIKRCALWSIVLKYVV